MAHHEESKAENHLAMSNDEYKHHKAGVYKTTIWLSIITIVEVAFAIFYDVYLVPKGWPKSFLRVLLVLMSLLKAYLIMAVFMHVKYEKKAFGISILLPFTLLIWMIIAFVMDGMSWNKFREDRFPPQTELVHNK